MTRACESEPRPRSHRLRLALGAIIGAETLGAAGIAVASIPGQGGVINGCLQQDERRAAGDRQRRRGHMQEPRVGDSVEPDRPPGPRGSQWPRWADGAAGSHWF